MDGDEKVEKRLDRAAEQDDRKSDRRITVWVAVIALGGVLLSTGASVLGAKWGASTALEVQQLELKAERQKQTRELCLQVSTELDKATKAVFPVKPKNGGNPDPDRVYEHAARWDALGQRAAFVAPLNIYNEVQKVSFVLGNASSYPLAPPRVRRSFEILEWKREEVLRELQERGVDPDTVRFAPDSAQARVEPDRPGAERERQQRRERQQQEVVEASRKAFEEAAHELGNACRSELGEEPLPAPSQR